MEEIVIEIPAGNTIEEIQEILDRMMKSVGKDPFASRTAKAREMLANAVWPENLETLFM